MSSGALFEGTCEVLDIRECSASDEFIDPCNCYDTYSCVNLEVIRRTCPQGTAFDGKRCDHENDVLLYDCDTDLPWERCNVSEARLNELELMCSSKSTTVTTEGTTTGISLSTSPTDSGADNTGLIIGLAVAGVIILVFVVILVVIFLRRKKSKQIEKKRQGTVHNPEYFEDGNRDDPYAVIDDSRHIPVHIDRDTSYMVPQSNRSIQSDTLQGSTIADTLPPNIDTVYDNPGSRAEPPSGYERTGNTLKPGSSEQQYYTLTKEPKQNENNNTLENGHTTSDSSADRTRTDTNTNYVMDNSVRLTGHGATIESNGNILSQDNQNYGVRIEDESPYNG